jgi:hypothetical protein
MNTKPITKNAKDKVEIRDTLAEKAAVERAIKEKEFYLNKLNLLLTSDKDNKDKKEKKYRDKLATIREDANEETLSTIDVKLQKMNTRNNTKIMASSETGKW